MSDFTSEDGAQHCGAEDGRHGGASDCGGAAPRRDDLQHYPTPDWLADRAVALFRRNPHRLLDACSGAGALALAWARRSYRQLDRSGTAPWPIDAVEIDARHHPALRAARINVVGLDFLAFEGGAIYSHVVMKGACRDKARFLS